MTNDRRRPCDIGILSDNIPVQTTTPENIGSVTDVEIRAQRDKLIEESGRLVFPNEERYDDVDFEHFDVLELLGKGAYGDVYKMRHKPSNKMMAVKKMSGCGIFREDRRILMDLFVTSKAKNHPYIILSYGHLSADMNHSQLWLCLELMDTCFDKLIKHFDDEGLPEFVIGHTIIAILNALSYLRKEHRLEYRDLKPSNILLNENGTQIKLCDFSVSGLLLNSQRASNTLGSYAYVAPELIELPKNKNPSRTDIWGVGITVYEMFHGKNPYYKYRNKSFQTQSEIVNGDAPRLAATEKRSPSKPLASFVEDCLQKDFRLRRSHDAMLQHAFPQQYAQEDMRIVRDWYLSFREKFKDSFTSAPTSSNF
ncbi:hypothetical protein SNEBB_007977 [Seison nebaliae]|nr:hypothetical protein SNEBB_007977 [Seison nebaliae]